MKLAGDRCKNNQQQKQTEIFAVCALCVCVCVSGYSEVASQRIWWLKSNCWVCDCMDVCIVCWGILGEVQLQVDRTMLDAFVYTYSRKYRIQTLFFIRFLILDCIYRMTLDDIHSKNDWPRISSGPARCGRQSLHRILSLRLANLMPL